MKNKKIVVTGGAGFIGSNIARKLAKDNQITILDNFTTGRRKNIDDLVANGVSLIKDDIRNISMLKRIFKGADYVFHQAAIASVPLSIQDPILANEVNLTGTLNVLVAARDNNVGRVVFASSCAVYGDDPTPKKAETIIPKPLSPYAVTKMIGEHYCRVFHEIYGLSAVSLRYFNVYGPYQDPKSDYAAAIPKFIEKLQRDKPPTIYGDGRQTRDFVFVEDVVAANISAAEKKSIDGQIINIASGKDTTINAIVTKLIKLFKSGVKPVYEEERKGEIKYSLADITKAGKLLGYEPKFNLESGLKKTVEYFNAASR
ncbi:MAG: SDR family oxidoreductase [Thermoplasmata archaeon]